MHPFLLCLRLKVLLGVFIGIVANSSVLLGQIRGPFPIADSFCVRSACTPPVLFCHITNVQNGVDTIDVRVIFDYMFLNNQSGTNIRHFYYVVDDPLNQYKYDLVLTRLSSYGQGPQNIPFDSSFFIYGKFDVSIYALHMDTIVDSEKVKLNAETAGAVSPNGVGEPTSLQLLPNFPNPFNPSTTINYEVAHRSHVIVKVCDLLGHEVALLVNGTVEPGRHAVSFNATGLPSGIYLAAIQNESKVRALKILHLQ